MIELGLLGLAAAGYAGSLYWNSYLRAIGLAVDDCSANRQDLAMNRLKMAILLPPIGRLVDHWALCLNFQSYLYIKQKQPDWAEKRLQLIERRPGICEAVRSLCFYRMAEINDLLGFPKEALACRQQALERFEAAQGELDSKALWKPLALVLYGTGDYAGAAEALERLLKQEWSAPILYLRWLSLENAGASRERRLAACREALKFETLPERRIYLLASAAEKELRSSPESALEALRACFEEQRKLGSSGPQMTEAATCIELEALSRLNRISEYEQVRDRLLGDLDPTKPEHLFFLGSVMLKENRFVEYLHLTESVEEPSVRTQRSVALFQVGRARDALDCFPDDDRWSIGSTLAELHLSLLDKPEAYRAIERLRSRDEKGYLEWCASKAAFWDGNLPLAQEQWPHSYPDPTLLMYQGRFESCMEARKREMELSAGAPSVKEQSLKYTQATLWMYQERWEAALQYFEILLQSSEQSPKIRDYCKLYALTCNCWMGEDRLQELEEFSHSLDTRYSQTPLIQRDIALTVADVLIGLKRYDQALLSIDTALPLEPRAFYRGFLLDLRSTALRSLNRETEAEPEDRAILGAAPGSFWAIRAAERLGLP